MTIILKSIETPAGVILNVSPDEARLHFGATDEAVQSALAAARLEALRQKRDALLRNSDWTQLPDAPLSAAAREAWQIYRQALRDLPSAAEPMPWPTVPQ